MYTIVLVRPQLQENVGAVARAMANFGFTDLRLVEPRTGAPDKAAYTMASGADTALNNARLYPDLASALADRTYAAALTARPRDLRQRLLTPRTLPAVLPPEGAALVFGPERTGLSADDIALCHAAVHVPTDAGFRSLNLAQCVLLVCYECFMQRTEADTDTVVSGIRNHTPAPHGEVTALFEHLETELDAEKFFYPPEKRPVMVRKLRAALMRAEFSAEEVSTLRGAVRALRNGFVSKQAAANTCIPEQHAVKSEQ